MKTLFNLIVAGMACVAIWLSLFPGNRQPSSQLTGASKRGDVEEVVYLSEIDGLVTAVMLYGVTNGITFQGTNYVFVVEDVGPATPPTPVVRRETVFHFNGSPDETYLIEGTLDRGKLIELGLFDDDMEDWIKQPTSVEIGSAVTSIEAFAFQDCSGLTTMTIPDSVTSLGYCAFSGCSGLTSVTIPDSVTSIGSYAFLGCSGLTSITMSGKIKATVQGMSGYSWMLPSGCVIHCTDGDITVQ